MFGTDRYFISAFIGRKMKDDVDIEIVSNMRYSMNAKFLFFRNDIQVKRERESEREREREKERERERER